MPPPERVKTPIPKQNKSGPCIVRLGACRLIVNQNEASRIFICKLAP